MSKKTLAMGAALSLDEVRRLAAKTSLLFTSVDPVMLMAMAKIESNFNPYAQRVEPLINDASIGLMQTLVSTAQWLARDMGFKRYGEPTSEDLFDPEKSMYFGAAYVQWLANYRGVPRDEKWIVMSYNGGPGADNPMTRNHWQKYQAAKNQILGVA